MKAKSTSGVAVLFACGVLAQAPQGEPFAAPSADLSAPAGSFSCMVPIHTAPDDPVGGPYGIWAAGSTYKVSFHGDVTFVPFLGRDQPGQAFSWRTVSVQVGQRELLQPGEKPRRSHGDFRYEYVFAAFTEAYDVLDAGLEQTFVLREPPGAAGDLRITGRIDGTLRADQLADEHSPVALRDDLDRELVRYGEATAVDAMGRRAAMRTSCDGGQITLVLEADWLAQAVFPVTVDPLLAPVRIATWGGATRGEPEVMDLAVDPRFVVGATVLVGTTRWVSGTDIDCWVYMCNRDFSNPRLVYSDLSGTWQTEGFCCTQTGQNYVMVFTRFFTYGISNQKALRWQARHVGDTAFNTTVNYITAGDGSYWRADVGGDRGGSTALLVYQHDRHPTAQFANADESRVRASLLDPATGTSAAPFDVDPPVAGIDQELPAVSFRTVPYEWIVVWQAYNNNVVDDDWDLWGRGIDSAGRPTRRWLSMINEVTPRRHKLAPLVDGYWDRFLVTFTTVETATRPGKYTGTSGTSHWTERFDFRGQVVARHPPVELLSGLGPRFVRLSGMAAARPGDHWAIQRFYGGSPAEIYVVRVGYRGYPVERGVLEPGTMAGTFGVGGGVAYDLVDRDFKLLYADDGRAGIRNWPVYGRAFRFPQVSRTSYGSSCGTGLIGLNSSQYLGSEQNYLTLYSGTPNQIAFALFSFAPDNQELTALGFPGCWLLVDVQQPNFLGPLGILLDATGAAEINVPVPEYLSPFTIYLQWLYGAPGANPGNALFTSALAADFR